MTDLKVLQTICDIIKDYTELPDGHIYIYNQKFFVPNKLTDCFVSVGLLHTKDIGNNRHTVNTDKEMITTQKLITVEIKTYSYDFSAMEIKDKITMSFRTSFCENISVKNGLQIQSGNINWRNYNELVGDKVLFQYIAELRILATNWNIKDNDVYDNLGDINLIVNN